ncbi:MAG TPA: DNA mismatch repair protein MutS [Chromatiales bacterium]|nr:DNA mismatch repair protein MutS [Chromatiales bacterium]
MDRDKTKSFADLVPGVRRLHCDRVEPYRKRTPPLPRQRLLDEQRVLRQLAEAPFEASDVLPGVPEQFHRPGVRKATLRKLHRGQYAIEAELDLHGCTSTQARAALYDFVRDAAHRGLRCVRVIHGKGRRSGNRGPVLKPAVAGWLRRCDTVLAYASARPVDGGTGALYVLLRRR